MVEKTILSDAHRKAISEGKKGSKHTEEHRKAISEGVKAAAKRRFEAKRKMKEGVIMQ